MSFLTRFSPAVSIQRTRHRAQVTKLTLERKMNLTPDTFFKPDTENGCNIEDACRFENELVHERTQKQETIWTAVRRTLMTWRQPTAHNHEIKTTTLHQYS